MVVFPGPAVICPLSQKFRELFYKCNGPFVMVFSNLGKFSKIHLHLIEVFGLSCTKNKLSKLNKIPTLRYTIFSIQDQMSLLLWYFRTYIGKYSKIYLHLIEVFGLSCPKNKLSKLNKIPTLRYTIFSIQDQISRTHLHYGIRDTTFAEPLYDRQLG